jgi:hypothetical protein
MPRASVTASVKIYCALHMQASCVVLVLASRMNCQSVWRACDRNSRAISSPLEASRSRRGGQVQVRPYAELVRLPKLAAAVLATVAYWLFQAIVLVFACCRLECGPTVARLVFPLEVASA